MAKQNKMLWIIAVLVFFIFIVGASKKTVDVNGGNIIKLSPDISMKLGAADPPAGCTSAGWYQIQTLIPNGYMGTFCNYVSQTYWPDVKVALVTSDTNVIVWQSDTVLNDGDCISSGICTNAAGCYFDYAAYFCPRGGTYSGSIHTSMTSAVNACNTVINSGACSSGYCKVYASTVNNDYYCVTYNGETSSACDYNMVWAQSQEFICSSASDGCISPTANHGDYTCKNGDIDICSDGTWSKEYDCEDWQQKMAPCLRSVARLYLNDAVNDCSGPSCDLDGVCDTGETAATCPTDCISNYCPTIGATVSCDAGQGVTGTKTCQADHTWGSCVGVVVCDNDGICDAGENVFTCPNDCHCNNNGVCEASLGEEKFSCVNDCPCDLGDISPCTVGACLGTKQCTSSHTWNTCVKTDANCNENGQCICTAWGTWSDAVNSCGTRSCIAPADCSRSDAKSCGGDTTATACLAFIQRCKTDANGNELDCQTTKDNCELNPMMIYIGIGLLVLFAIKAMNK